MVNDTALAGLTISLALGSTTRPAQRQPEKHCAESQTSRSWEHGRSPGERRNVAANASRRVTSRDMGRRTRCTGSIRGTQHAEAGVGWVRRSRSVIALWATVQIQPSRPWSCSVACAVVRCDLARLGTGTGRRG